VELKYLQVFSEWQLPDVQQHRVEDVDAERTRVVCGKLLSSVRASCANSADGKQ